MIAKASENLWVTSINKPPNNSETNPSSETAVDSSAWTIKRLLDWTTDFFKEQGAEQSRLDAEVLLAEAMGCQRIELYTRFDEEPSETQRSQFRDWVRRHGEGEPVAYLVGHREFFSLRFEVNDHVLIPRPETEHLVSEALDRIKPCQTQTPDRQLTLVDVGTGAGNVAITLACHCQDVRVLACDISEDALQVAQHNAATHQVDGRIEWLVSDLLAQLPSDTQLDFVISNPPYIGLDEKASLDRSVVDFEPHTALFSEGPTGTETIERLILQSQQALVPGGWLLLEVSPMIAERTVQLMAQANFHPASIVKDLAGLDRIVIAQKK